jgi:hypothetical protein
MTDAGSIVGRSEPDARSRCEPHQAVTGYYTTLPLGGALAGTPGVSRGSPGGGRYRHRATHCAVRGSGVWGRAEPGVPSCPSCARRSTWSACTSGS